MLKNIKLRVDNENISKQVQAKAFKLGYFWEYPFIKNKSKTEYHYLNSRFLYFNNDGVIFHGNDKAYFYSHINEKYEIISYKKFLKI